MESSCSCYCNYSYSNGGKLVNLKKELEKIVCMFTGCNDVHYQVFEAEAEAEPELSK